MKFRFAIILVLASGLLSACNFSLASDITPPPDYKSPTPKPTLGALYPDEPPAPQSGYAIYVEKCAPCHGDEGRGDGPQGLQLNVKVPAFGLPSAGRAAIPSNYFTTVSQGRIENFMPPFSGSLNEQQVWDVVSYALSLHTSADELAQGKTLYETNCANCHGADGSTIAKVNLSDQQFMAKRSEQDIFNAVTSGVPEVMPAFDQLTEDERWALAAYVRSLTFADVQATATPQPSPTEAATPTPAAATPEGASLPAATAEGSAQPVLDATPVPTTAPNTTGKVTGSVANASGAAFPAGISVTLFGYDHGQDATAPEQALELAADVLPDGTYSFENVAIPEGRFFVTQLDYQGIPYESEIAITEPGATELAIAPIVIYETTDDLTNLQVKQGHLIIQFDETRIGVLEFFAISNSSDKTVVFTTDGQTLPFAPMPEGVEPLGFDLQQGEAQFLPTENGFAIPPSDKLYAAVTGFALPYNKKADITVSFGIAVPSVNLIAPVGLKIKSDQLASEPPDPQSQNQVFSGGPFNPGDQLTLNISGAPKAESAPATSADDNTNLLIGIGALGLALIAVGVFFFLRDRRKTQDGDDDDENPIGEPAGESAEEIMDAIIALDDQFRTGNITEETYQKRRAELKTQLKEQL